MGSSTDLQPPEEFEEFIGEEIRLSPVLVDDKVKFEKILEYYMGKNTEDRQKFIIENLRIEKDDPDQVAPEVLEMEA